ncbi:exocyst complex subunit 8 [Tieghemostelium lacteum]|uniref:Exocyst complex subunit 8 n=1 Tax=Tieghemostelium lacteum TaxID=361077 RepID=A0A151ZCZ9_TIELA|nr:exocyst complex subunit 8 [Tieghemostelium lacteum]|eukprot:KYQ91826.1 exocyst complex subunit 8 [Tieghemostelium lacteum]
MKKGVIYNLNIDNHLSTAVSSVVYQNIECTDIRPNGIYVLKFMYREWVGTLNLLTTQKSSIKLSIDPKEFTVTCLHTDKKKTVYRWDTKTAQESQKTTDENNPIQYSTFTTHPFNLDKYVNDLFTNHSDQHVTNYVNYLNDRKMGCIVQLKKDVYKNHLIFIAASKEIANSEVDMLDFRNLVMDYGQCIQSLQNSSINWDYYNSNKSSKIEYDTLNTQTKPIQWLTSAPNELELAIEQREFENAVGIVENINKIYNQNPKVENVMQTHPLKDQIESRIKSLSDKLMNELRSPLLKPNQIKETISLLVRLSQNDKAKSIFLESRTVAIKKLVKKVAISGDLLRYISELTKIIFNNINSTCDDFTNSFPSYMNSGLISWVMEELVYIADLFNRQVFILDNFQLISQAIRIVESHCEMMDNNGLSISFYWNLLLLPHIEQLIVNYELKMRDQILHKLAEERWLGITSWDYEITSPLSASSGSSPTVHASSLSSSFVKSKYSPNQQSSSSKYPNYNQNSSNNIHDNDSKLKLTDSTIFLNTIIQRFTNDICQILTPSLTDLIPVISNSLSKIFKEYVIYLNNEIIQKENLSDLQCLAIISNSLFIVEDLVFRTANKFEDATDGERLSNLPQLTDQLNNTFELIQEQYSIKKARDILINVMIWDEEDYRIEDEIEAFPKKFIKLSEYLDQLAEIIQTNVNSDCVLPIISRLISEIVIIISQRLENSYTLFGYGGLQYFVLEMKYLSTFAGRFSVEDVTFELINSMIESGVKAYAEINNFEPNTVLKPEEYFSNVIDNLVYQKAVYKE